MIALMLAIFVLQCVQLAVVLLLLHGKSLRSLAKPGEKRPAPKHQPAAFQTTKTLLLRDEDGIVQYEVHVHVAQAPLRYVHAGVIYHHIRDLDNNRFVYQTLPVNSEPIA